MVCGSCHANVSRTSHELQGYTFGLQPGLIQDSGGFCQIVSSQREDNFSSVFQGPDLVGALFLFLGLCRGWGSAQRFHFLRAMKFLRIRSLSIGQTMKVFIGIVTTGYGLATPNLAPVLALIETRTGLTNLAPGTLNVKICEEYIVQSDAVLNPDEYPFNRETNLGEPLKIQRCLVAGYKALIVRTDSLEIGSRAISREKQPRVNGTKAFSNIARPCRRKCGPGASGRRRRLVAVWHLNAGYRKVNGSWKAFFFSFLITYSQA